jgi:hypothetical protein
MFLECYIILFGTGLSFDKLYFDLNWPIKVEI